MKLNTWQFYWRRWHLTARAYYDEEFGFYDIIVVVGPFQLWFVQG
jgi:hypothetical protein